jgi:hypothetical protein
LKKCSIGVTQYRNNVDEKIKLIRYDPNGVPWVFSLNSATCIFSVLYAVYVLDLDSKVLFTSLMYILSNDPVNLVIFGIRKCA